MALAECGGPLDRAGATRDTKGWSLGPANEWGGSCAPPLQRGRVLTSPAPLLKQAPLEIELHDGTRVEGVLRQAA